MGMYRYWRDKYGDAKEAVEAADATMLTAPRIAYALAQIEAAELLIAKVMEEHEEKDED